MAFYGNSMFGHHMQMAAYTNNYGSSFGGRGGYGGKSGFGQSSHGSGGFGRSREMPTDPHSLYMEAHNNPEFMQQNHGFMRQNSLLSSMTRSKDERDKKPWGVVSFGYGLNQDNAMLPFNIYDKPLEKTDKPKLERMDTCPVTFGVDMEHKRAPSFKSNPEKMRGKTISSSSLPSTGRPSLRKLGRSISINEDLTTPANMDIAGPMLRRQQSLDAEKAKRRNSTASGSSRSKFPFTFGKKRKSTKSTSDADSIHDTISLSIPGTPRSRAQTLESKDSALTTDSARSKHDDKDQEKLILSLLNPEVPDNHESGYDEQPLHSHDESKDYTDSPLESPTVVSKRVQEYLPLPENHSVPESEEFIGRGTGTPTKGSSIMAKNRFSPSSMPQRKQLSKCSEATDSDASDPYYDCNQSTPSPANSSQRKKRSLRKKRLDTSTSTCTDCEDTTSSNCGTPPRKVKDSQPPRLYPDTKGLVMEDEPHRQLSYEDVDTLRIGHKPSASFDSVARKKPTISSLSKNKFSKTLYEPEDCEALIEPAIVNVVSNDPDQKDQLTDPCTADSSESGYATSYKQSTPRDYHQKVSEFVNSLPSKPMMADNLSGKHPPGLHGSISDIEMDEEKPRTRKHKNDFPDEVSCISGSDSEHESAGDMSVSKLEVMKLLESPTEVRARVNDTMTRKKENQPSNELPSPTYLYKKEIEPDSNEPLQGIKTETADKSEQIEKPDKPATKHVEVNCVPKKEDDSNKEEKIEFKRQKSSTKSHNSSFGRQRPKKFSFSRQISTMYQSNSTSCVDLVLHFFNFLLFVTSAAIIGLSIWLLLKDFNVNDVTIILGNDLLKIIIYVSITGSAVAMLAAFCLCCGMRQDKVGLGFYAIILIVVICAFATAAVLATIFSDKLTGIEFKFHFKDRLKSMYGSDLNRDCEELTKAWDLMQAKFACCGGEGNVSGSDSWALYRNSYWIENLPETDKSNVFVPESCCAKNSNTKVCQGGDGQIFAPPRFGLDYNPYLQENVHLNTEGCYKYFASYLKTLCMYIAVTVGSLAGVYALIVMLTWLFCFKKRKDYRSYYDDSYTDYGDTDEVFDESFNRSRPQSDNIEETSFASSKYHGRHQSRERERDEVDHVSRKPSYSRQSPRYGRHSKYEQDPRYDGDVRYNKSNRYEQESRSEQDYRYGKTNRYDHGNRYEQDDRHSHRYSDIEEDEYSDSENGDAVSRANVKSQEEVVARRNMWLSSGVTAGHLLSTAIEEEEDSKEHVQDSRYRKYP